MPDIVPLPRLITQSACPPWGRDSRDYRRWNGTMQGRPPIVTGFTMPSGRAARPASSASCVLSGRDPDVRGGGPHLPSLHRPLRSRATATAPRPSKSRWAASGRRSLSSWVLRSPTVTEDAISGSPSEPHFPASRVSGWKWDPLRSEGRTSCAQRMVRFTQSVAVGRAADTPRRGALGPGSPSLASGRPRRSN